MSEGGCHVALSLTTSLALHAAGIFADVSGLLF